jgi:hypothetical protein
MLSNDFSHFNNVICHSVKCFKFSVFEDSHFFTSMNVSIRINSEMEISRREQVVCVYVWFISFPSLHEYLQYILQLKISVDDIIVVCIADSCQDL